MHPKESVLASVMNYMVSGYVYFVAFTLVLYMVSTLVAGMLEVGSSLLTMSIGAKNILNSPERAILELQLLHTIAFTIVLVKAYKILIAYAETRHINLKFLVEIAIIAPTIELIFNAKSYSFEVMIVMATFAFANLVAYLSFYHTIKTVSHDYIRELCVPEEEEKVSRKKKSTRKNETG